MSFSRDVLKWLQSLDLSYPIKHPRRDFANGFLVAEMFSRYYPGQLLIPCFYTGNSTLQKRKNWDQLEKFFKNNDMNIPKDAIQAVIDCQVDAAILFVENTYTLLTGKRVHKAPPSEGSAVPHFALPTTSTIIRTVAENPVKATERKKMEEKQQKQLRQLAKSLLEKDGKLSPETKALFKSQEQLRKSLPNLISKLDEPEPAYYKHITVKQSH